MKQRLEKYSERFDNKDNELVEGVFNPENWGKRFVEDKPKQETLEEAIDRISKEDGYDIEGGKVADFVDGMVKGAKWQQERSYSEEDVIKIVKKSRETGLTAEYLLLTEQFKNKKYYERNRY